MTWQPPASWTENVDLREWHTFHLPVKARYALEVHRPRQLISAVQSAREADLPVLFLGGGSNVLFTDDYPGLVARIAMLGVHPEPKQNGDVLVTAMAGENWHELVAFCLQQGWHGLENLALIPGSVGAAPVQNIGAYGVEVGELIDSVTYLDLHDSELRSLNAEECQFAYRDSIFKQALRDRAVIISCTLRLRKTARINMTYPALQEVLGVSGSRSSEQSTPTPQDVFDAVCAIRRSKLPDPMKLGNAGSFFRNPIISKTHWQSLQQQWPELPAFPVTTDANQASDDVKVPAAWLIEKAGWKGVRRGQIGVHDRQALVLINDFQQADSQNDNCHQTANPGQALLVLAKEIADSVAEQFGVRLEPEVGIQPPGAWTS